MVPLVGSWGNKDSPPPSWPTECGNKERPLLTRNIYLVQGRQIDLKSVHKIISINSKAINITA